MKAAEKKDQISRSEMTAFLEEGCRLEGDMVFSGIVRINGSFLGKIRSEDGLIIGAPAKVEGTVQVGSANIGGRVKGNIEARDRIEIQSTGNVQGSVTAPIIVIHEGAQIVGDVRIIRASA